MSKEIKTRQVHKDVKALDKTVTGMERVKQAYVRTKETVEKAQPQEKRYASPRNMPRIKRSGGADRAVHEAAHQARKQGGRLADKAKEKHRISKETKETREAAREGEVLHTGAFSVSPGLPYRQAGESLTSRKSR